MPQGYNDARNRINRADRKLLEIDHQAPVIAQAAQRIKAPIDTLWHVLTNVEAWPNWHHDIVDVSIDGPLEPGTQFVWRSGGFKIRSTFQEVVPRTRIAWIGKTTGTQVFQVWQFELEGDSTRVTTAESLSGWLPRLFQKRMQDSLQSTLESWVHVFRLKCEGMQIEPDLPAPTHS